jgi:hypothetical protein
MRERVLEPRVAELVEGVDDVEVGEVVEFVAVDGEGVLVPRAVDPAHRADCCTSISMMRPIAFAWIGKRFAVQTANSISVTFLKLPSNGALVLLLMPGELAVPLDEAHRDAPRRRARP